MTAVVAAACLPGCGSPHQGAVGNGLARVWPRVHGHHSSLCVQLWVAASFSGSKPGAPLDTIYNAEDLGHRLQW